MAKLMYQTLSDSSRIVERYGGRVNRIGVIRQRMGDRRCELEPPLVRACHHEHKQDSHDAFEIAPYGCAHLMRPSFARRHTLCICCRNVGREKERICVTGIRNRA